MPWYIKLAVRLFVGAFFFLLCFALFSAGQWVNDISRTADFGSFTQFLCGAGFVILMTGSSLSLLGTVLAPFTIPDDVLFGDE